MLWLKAIFIRSKNIKREYNRLLENKKVEWEIENEKKTNKEKLEICMDYEQKIKSLEGKIKELEKENKRQKKLVPLLEGKIFAMDRSYEYLDPTIDELIKVAARIKSKKNQIEQIKYTTYRRLPNIKKQMRVKEVTSAS